MTLPDLLLALNDTTGTVVVTRAEATPNPVGDKRVTRELPKAGTPRALTLASALLSRPDWAFPLVFPFEGAMGVDPKQPARLLHYSGRGSWVTNDGAVPHRDGPVVPALYTGVMLGTIILATRRGHGCPTLHARPTADGWYIERWTQEEHEWLRWDGTWGHGEAPPVCEATDAEAYTAALLIAHGVYLPPAEAA